MVEIQQNTSTSHPSWQC